VKNNCVARGERKKKKKTNTNTNKKRTVKKRLLRESCMFSLKSEWAGRFVGEDGGRRLKVEDKDQS